MITAGTELMPAACQALGVAHLLGVLARGQHLSRGVAIEAGLHGGGDQQHVVVGGALAVGEIGLEQGALQGLLTRRLARPSAAGGGRRRCCRSGWSRR
jgi:hypothetical protein